MDDGSSPLPGVLIFLIFTVISVVMNTFRAALLNISESNAEKEAESGNGKYAYMLRLIEEPFLLNSTAQVVTMLFGMAAGLSVVRRFSGYFHGIVTPYITSTPGWVISGILIVLIMLILSISVGYLAPQKIGSYHAESCAVKLVGAVHLIIMVMTPVTFFLNRAANGLVRLFGIDPYHYQDDVTEDEIIDLVDEAHEQGVILESEAEMIQNIMAFGDKTARDIMTHRKNVNAIEASTTLGEAMAFMLENSNTRYPVYHETIDNIIGIIHMKDAAIQMIEHNQQDAPVCEIKNLVRYVGFIPETRNIDSIFKAMQAKKVHMTIVIDEYGQTSGIATMEDILEEIVGNILDEYDDSDDFIQPQFDDSMLMDGLTPLEQVGEVLGLDFDDQDFETLNGYLTSLLGHIPTEEDKEVEALGYRFQILVVEDNIIQKLRVTKGKQEEGEDTCLDIQNSQT